MKLVRLSSGEEIVGKVIERKNEIEISDAYSLVATEPGKMGFIPFKMFYIYQHINILFIQVLAVKVKKAITIIFLTCLFQQEQQQRNI